MSQEIWRAIPGFGGWYEASSRGRIRSVDRVVEKMHGSGVIMHQKYKGRLLNPTCDDGYLRVQLSVNKKRSFIGVHRLVLLAFSGGAEDGQVGRHLNGNTLDNRPENLAWGSHLDNMADRKAHGNYQQGEGHPMAKLKEGDVLQIRNSTESGVALSKKYRVGTSHISRIKRNQNWVHI